MSTIFLTPARALRSTTFLVGFDMYPLIRLLANFTIECLRMSNGIQPARPHLRFVVLPRSLVTNFIRDETSVVSSPTFRYD